MCGKNIDISFFSSLSDEVFKSFIESETTSEQMSENLWLLMEEKVYGNYVDDDKKLNLVKYPCPEQ